MFRASTGSLCRACAVVACLWVATRSQAGVQALELSCATVAGHSFKLAARQHPAQPVVLTSSDRVAFLDGCRRESLRDWVWRWSTRATRRRRVRRKPGVSALRRHPRMK
jgi:hypothetical protein